MQLGWLTSYPGGLSNHLRASRVRNGWVNRQRLEVVPSEQSKQPSLVPSFPHCFLSFPGAECRKTCGYATVGGRYIQREPWMISSESCRCLAVGSLEELVRSWWTEQTLW